MQAGIVRVCRTSRKAVLRRRNSRAPARARTALRVGASAGKQDGPSVGSRERTQGCADGAARLAPTRRIEDPLGFR
jgi:hypothetical protein